jgi:hypothetical protein
VYQDLVSSPRKRVHTLRKHDESDVEYTPRDGFFVFPKCCPRHNIVTIITVLPLTRTVYIFASQTSSNQLKRVRLNVLYESVRSIHPDDRWDHTAYGLPTVSLRGRSLARSTTRVRTYYYYTYIREHNFSILFLFFSSPSRRPYGSIILVTVPNRKIVPGEIIKVSRPLVKLLAWEFAADENCAFSERRLLVVLRSFPYRSINDSITCNHFIRLTLYYLCAFVSIRTFSQMWKNSLFYVVVCTFIADWYRYEDSPQVPS